MSIAMSGKLDYPPKGDLVRMLSIIWPDSLRTSFLRACLGTPEEAKAAWQEFTSVVGDPKRFIEADMSGFKALLPLLHASARRNEFELDTALWTYLRSATVREELRYGAYRDICSSILAACSRAGLPVVALKACALAEICYENPAQRHCHAVDLLVPADSLPVAMDIAASQGFRPARLIEHLPGARVGLRHEHGLPLILHANLFDPPVYRFETSPLWSGSSEAVVAGVPVRILSPAHNLLHVLVSSFHDPRRNNLRWVCDAWRLIEMLDDAEWQDLRDLVRASGLKLPVSVMLQYLAGALGAKVPAGQIELHGVSGRQTDPAEIDVALSAALGSLSGLQMAWSKTKGSPLLRRAIVKFLVYPSGDYIRWRYGANGASVLSHYIFRPFSQMARQLWWHLLKLPPFSGLTRYGRVAAELKKRRA